MKYRPPKLVQTPPAITKIDERRKQEEYDRAHPWQAMESAIINDGAICEMLFSDMAKKDTARYFLGEDDHWYRIDPPEKMPKSAWYAGRTPMNWRSTGKKITPDKRSAVMRRANRDVYSGGRYHGDDPTW